MNAAEAAAWLNAELVGDPERPIDDIRPLDAAGARDASFLDNLKHLRRLRESAAGVVICPAATEPIPGKTLLRVTEPRLAFARLLGRLHPRTRLPEGIHPSAHIDPTATIGDGARIAPGVVIGAQTTIGRNAEISAFCVIGCRVTVGDDALFYPSVTVYDGCRIGRRVILHAAAVIGSDGFGYVTDGSGTHRKIPQTGIAVIEDDVEIGAHSAVDRATMGATVVGKGTKIDNLVQVGHNVTIGSDGLICAQVGISGSCTIGHHVILAGQAGLADHLRIGDRVILCAQTGAHKDVPEGAVLLGTSVAHPAGHARRIVAAQNKLPEMRRELVALKARLAALEGAKDPD